jgi:hypothetical protein
MKSDRGKTKEEKRSEGDPLVQQHLIFLNWLLWLIDILELVIIADYGATL